MDIIVDKGCGLDVHKGTVVDCIMGTGIKKEVKTYTTMTNDLLRLKEWLQENGITHVAMEKILSEIERRIQQKINRHYKEEYELLQTIPGVKESASTIIAERGGSFLLDIQLHFQHILSNPK